MTTPTSLEPAATAPRTLPLVPLRDMVVFPRMMAPFVVGRASSISALEAALAAPEKTIFLARAVMSTKPPAPAVTCGLTPSLETLTDPERSICRNESIDMSKPPP